ncbi:HpcH/HpaI aldolase/citrate lyase family protein, partial [Bacillus pumilus]|uniref:HpcH/HpaI aldolase/citrate lyase family protein n=1 Tax=Bacillus pumilus TaxID=1408 RepID=UPI001642670D
KKTNLYQINIFQTHHLLQKQTTYTLFSHLNHIFLNHHQYIFNIPIPPTHLSPFYPIPPHPHTTIYHIQFIPHLITHITNYFPRSFVISRALSEH